MRTIIAGSRSITNLITVKKAIDQSGFKITSVVCGMARGVDKCGEAWAKMNGVPVDPHPCTSSDWTLYGKAAGMRRNERMSKVADALIAIWDGESSSTKDMIDRAKSKNLKVYIHMVEPVNKEYEYQKLLQQNTEDDIFWRDE